MVETNIDSIIQILVVILPIMLGALGFKTRQLSSSLKKGDVTIGKFRDIVSKVDNKAESLQGVLKVWADAFEDGKITAEEQKVIMKATKGFITSLMDDIKTETKKVNEGAN